jgi:hypothetical protein
MSEMMQALPVCPGKDEATHAANKSRREQLNQSDWSLALLGTVTRIDTGNELTGSWTPPTKGLSRKISTRRWTHEQEIAATRGTLWHEQQDPEADTKQETGKLAMPKMESWSWDLCTKCDEKSTGMETSNEPAVGNSSDRTCSRTKKNSGTLDPEVRTAQQKVRQFLYWNQAKFIQLIYGGHWPPFLIWFETKNVFDSLLN